MLKTSFKVSIIIPNYNGEKLLRKNLPSVIKAAPNQEIIIVDDCSTDGSVVFLRKQFPHIHLIINDANKGFSFSVNRGVREAHGDIVVLLNTDVAPQKDFLPPLVSHFKDQAVFAVGCIDHSFERRKIVERGRGIGRFTRGFLRHERGEVGRTNTLWVSGGSSAFRKSIWDFLGGFDTLYNPFYWEDIDLSYRALKAGYRIVFEPKSIVEHRHDEGSILSSFSASAIKRISYRNQFIFVWKNCTDPVFILAHFLWLPYHIMRALVSLDIPFFLGGKDALLQWRKIFQKRKNVSLIWKKTDTEVLGPFYEEMA